jgi:hypothetical protein
MPLYHTLFNVYEHKCITKDFGKWFLVGVELYKGFPSVKKDTELSCVKKQWVVE